MAVEKDKRREQKGRLAIDRQPLSKSAKKLMYIIHIKKNVKENKTKKPRQKSGRLLADNLWKFSPLPGQCIYIQIYRKVCISKFAEKGSFSMRGPQKGALSFRRVRAWMIDGPFRAFACNYKMNDAFLFKCFINMVVGKKVDICCTAEGLLLVVCLWAKLIFFRGCDGLKMLWKWSLNIIFWDSKLKIEWGSF